MARKKREEAAIGRPRSPYSTRSQVRHTPEQRRAWEEAAKRDDREFQSWVRHVLDQAAAT